MPINKTSLTRRSRSEFTQDYRMKVFTIWYNSGKPSSERLYSMLVADDIKEAYSGDMPSKSVVNKWVSTDFEIKATFLDSQVAKDLERRLVASKIQMLQSHIKIGQELADMGIEYLRENGIGNSRNALSAIIEGIRIEKESAGANIKFADLEKMSDDQLFEEVVKIVQGSEIISIEPND